MQPQGFGGYKHKQANEQKHSWQFCGCALFGMVSLRRLSDLQLGGKKVTA